MDGNTSQFASPALLAERSVGECIALGEPSRTVADLTQAAGRVRRAIERAGCAEVVLACRDRYHVAACLLGTWAANGVVSIPSTLNAEAVLSLAEEARIKLVLSDDGEIGTDVHHILEDRGGSSRGPVDGLATLSADQHLVTVYTSGTTGDAVACKKTAKQLIGEAVFLARFFGIGRGTRVIATAPPHHLFGLLFGVLTPLVGGGAFVRATSSLPDGIARAVRRHAANVLCAVPAHLSGFAALAPSDLPTIERVFCSGGRLDSHTLQVLVDRFPFELVEVFGSSETGGLAYRDPRQTAAWQPFEKTHVMTDADGRLLVDSPFIPPEGPRPFPCADLVTLNADGSFQHVGRIDDVVKIGGERVSIVEVQDKLRAVLGVQDAAIVKAFVDGPRQWELWAAVVAPGLDQSSLRRALSRTLEPVAMPRRFMFVPTLPRGDSGKVVRQRLLSMFENAAEGGRSGAILEGSFVR